MSMKGLSIDTDVESSDQDVIPGEGGYTLPTGVYPMVVDVAYMGKSAKGAVSLNLHLKQAKGGKTIVRQTLWVASGDKKGNKNYYIDKNKKKRLLPGMAQADHIAQITTGQSLAALTPEEKTIKLYDFEKRAELPTKVAALTEMHTKEIYVGLKKVRTNKVVKNQSGGYDDTAAERVFNEIDKVFYPDGMTIAEKKSEATEAKFIGKWKKRFPDDFVDDQYKAVEAPADPDALPDDSADAAATASLFSD